MSLIVAAGISAAAMGATSYFQSHQSQAAANDASDRAHASSAWALRENIDAFKHRYQWTMEDMKAAGLNPILAAGSGGFSVGNAPQATAPQVFKAQTATADLDLAGSARDIYTAYKTEAEIDLIRDKSKLTLAKAAESRANAKLITKQEQEVVKRITKTLKEIDFISSKTSLNKQQQKILVQKLAILQADYKRLQKIAKIYETPTGTGLLWIESFMKAIGLPVALLTGIGAAGGSRAPKIER